MTENYRFQKGMTWATLSLLFLGILMAAMSQIPSATADTDEFISVAERDGYLQTSGVSFPPTGAATAYNHSLVTVGQQFSGGTYNIWRGFMSFDKRSP